MNIKILLQAVVIGAIVCVGSVRAADAVYQNDGIVVPTDFVQVDAFTFINNGFFQVAAPIDFTYETQNTINYTNRGVMRSTPGFRFTTVNDFGRRPAAVIHNQGQIEAVDSLLFGTIIVDDDGVPTGSAAIDLPASRLIIDATNVVNRGLLSAGQGGIIKIGGKTLDLSRGGIRTGVSPSGSSTDVSGIFNTNFHLNSQGIFDYYWGSGTNQVLGDAENGQPISLNFPGSGFSTLPPEPYSPFHQVFLSGFDVEESFIILNLSIPLIPASISNQYSAFVHTNFFAGSTSVVNQVVFINTNVNQGQIKSEVKWIGDTPIVRLAFTEFDPVLEANLESALYIVDDMLLETNLTYTTNILYRTGRPRNYFVFKDDSFNWDSPFLSVSTTPFQFFQHIWSPLWTLNVVTNLYTGYSFTVNQNPNAATVAIPDNVFGNFVLAFTGIDYGFGAGFGALTDATNQQGRIEIATEGKYDARFTRLRSENYMSVKAGHFDYNTNTVFNAPIMSLDLASTNGFLGITNLVPGSVGRFIGQINLYSAKWTNFVVNFNPTDPTATNTTPIITHVLIVDNGAIQSERPVELQLARLTADNIVLDNDISLSRGLVMNGTNVTVNSELIVRGVDNTISSTNFPRLVNFENNGSTLVGSYAYFGSAETPLASFVNNGIYGAYGTEIHAGYFKGGGTFLTGGGFGGAAGPSRIYADTIDLESATFFNGGDMTLTGDTLLSGLSSVRIGDITITAAGQEFVSNGALFVDISGQIDDGGIGANNNWRVSDGFHLRRLPAGGDFMGTRLTSRAGRFREIHHTWAGVDLGADEDGYLNNGALGRLILSGDRLPLFVFDTIDGNNALYVDFLQLDSAATNVLSSLEIKPGMKIYFANANVPVGQLDGLFADEAAPGGRLRYVPRSTAVSTTVVVNGGQAGGITQALMTSQVVDSDGDGIPNAQDPTPFDGVVIDVELLSGNSSATRISWNGAARTEYQVQYRAAFEDADSESNWQSLTNVVTGSAANRINVEDPVGATEKRFYRVIYSP